MQILDWEVKSCPAVLQYQLAADGHYDDPQVVFVKRAIARGEAADTSELVVVSGPLAQPAALASALRLAACHAGARLRIAFCQRSLDDSPAAGQAPPALLAAFDAVFVNAADDAALAACWLVRALTVPAESNRWIGCDWSGMCDLLANARGKRAHYGFGSASRRQDCGADAAETAYSAATAQLEQQGGRLREAQGVCLALMTAGPDLAAKDGLAILARLRCALRPGATIFLSMGCDDAIPPGMLNVNLFAFGAHDATEVAPAPQSTGHASASNSIYEQARALVAREGRASVSLVQRHLHISYRHAASLMAAIGDDLPATPTPDGSQPHLPAWTTTDRKETSYP
ncbi:MAG: hypothetical protein JWR40_2324 [Massilia sp.]|nr:hypothetical protein [Massilia sp.]